jgi:hypothetical protein
MWSDGVTDVRSKSRPTATKDLRAEYERAVRNVARQVSAMRENERDVEIVARSAHAARQRIALAYKGLTPEPLRSRIRERTIATYGQASGPSIDYLREQGKSWEEIADGAARPGRGIALNEEG